MSKDYLILGANGLLGSSVVENLPHDATWLGTCFHRPVEGLYPLDITDKDQVQRVFEQCQPKRVLYCVNLKGGVDFCEKNPAAAKKLHFDATQIIGNECQKYNSKFLYLSTECVFDGQKEEYVEEDRRNPQNEYGQWKAESEKWIQLHLKDYLIIRTMSIFGWQPQTQTPNALMKLYFSIQKKEKIAVPTFRWGTPTYVHDLAKALLMLAQTPDVGIYHVAGQSYLSRYDWMKKTCERLGWDSSCLIAATEPTVEMVFRPYKVKLNTDKIWEKHKIKLPTLEESLSLLKEEIEKKVS